jgi:tight adherence protein B
VDLLDARLSPDGTTRLVVNVDGLEGTVLEADAFRVLEDGVPVEEIQVEPQTETAEVRVIVALAFDISGSVAPVFEQIQDGARTFVTDMADRGIQVALIPFSAEVEVTAPPTTNVDLLTGAIDDLVPGGITLLYDAIVTSAELIGRRLDDEEATLARIVVFSDGGDNGSEATIDEAIAAAQEIRAPIITVGWETAEFDPDAMQQMAEATGGTVAASADASDVAELFAEVSRDIASVYVLRYHSEIFEPTELPVTVVVDTPAGEVQVESLAINPRQPPPEPLAPPREAILPAPVVEFFDGPVGLWSGIGAAFLALLMLLWVLLVRPSTTAGGRALERGLRLYSRGGEVRDEEITLPTQRLTERFVDLVGRVPKPKGFDERLQLRLDRAAWPLRTNEFVVMVVMSAALGGLVLGGLTRSWIVGLAGALIGGAIPLLVLSVRIERRTKAFLEQLPGTLQMLAASLKAGYGLLQAIDTVVQEADAPTSTELAPGADRSTSGHARRGGAGGHGAAPRQRGLPLGRARHRHPARGGGNLAELLDTVAKTMRNRAALRRQIRVLSAEGRLSAWVIGLMPFVVALALQILNPGYLAQLFERFEGLVMLAFAGALLLVGVLWLRKTVDVEV